MVLKAHLQVLDQMVVAAVVAAHQSLNLMYWGQALSMVSIFLLREARAELVELAMVLEEAAAAAAAELI
ncbi:hypothetical protein MKK63_16880 [Methylobacterium sp. J-088]|uniref:hypothetical protein n=1 Tax=Methylobacterium sp. J-088 TaxID=2836664 RepID=UPI001FBAD1E4|nr:hypothetical protein [Methylobacterium sp. J-088]MCJ2064376.1 hypothetical protein [Methylobacterium sp. J-088]